ncbi:uncharacterized protein F4807DRAFT_434362 [Annulohypoxylon truncatum]|uniref:uncharacterized protein n=1 Tax=Annulohypoxylon truncatum TaxID=327061 RepID=UPI0020086E10|nr:uncharacterized protein F4807DRAFT_434362 [Annulohypoxylon truncatum]KAI1207719.1 hypothetical protein F4807DRAFT_434362 [Annulohypoxylon truncatum]
MVSSRKLVAQVLSLFSRASDDVPAACYNACNNAYLEAQRIGKQPALCAADSDFSTYLQSCYNCVEENGGSETSLSQLDQFVDYCNATTPIPVNHTLTTSYPVVTEVLPHTVTSGGSVVGTWFFTTNITILPSVSVVEITKTLGGKLTTFTFTTTYSSLPTGQAQAPNETSMNSPAHDPGPATPANRAWIAGPVVGGVVGVSIILLGSFFLWRHRRSKRESSTELEAQETSGPKYELDAPNRPQELDTVSSRATRTDGPQELGVNG